MKKLIALTLICGLSPVATLTPRPAQASLAVLFTKDFLPAAIIVGAAGLQTAAFTIDLFLKGNEQHGSKAVLSYLGSALYGAITVLLLDGEQGASIEFHSLSEKQARSLGLTQSEQDGYNSEISQINAVREEITLRMQPEFNQTSELRLEESLQKIHQHWTELSPTLSPEAFSAVQKISKKLSQRK